MFADLWPDVPDDETPITSVTNGVHALTWVSAEMDDLLSRYVLPEWDEAGSERWDRIDEARDDEVWRAKEQGREQLVAFVRRRLRESALARGMSPSDVVVVRRGARPQGAHDLLRPPLRHLQAGHAAAVAARPAARRCCWRATGRCSSCSPARPIPPTRPARR